jgi:hypothetical protein
MEKLSKKLDLSDELLSQGDSITEFVQSESKNISSANYADIMNISIMSDDFAYVRETLKEITENARRVQNAITLELLNHDGDKRASLVVSFAELSRAITDAQKLYVDSYKQMSGTLLNLDKIKKAEELEKLSGHTVNNLHIHGSEAISTLELMKKLKKE